MRRQPLVTAILIACALAAPAPTSAQATAPKEAPPTPGVAKNFVVPQPTRVTLQNGLPVTLVPFGTVPKVRLQLVVDSGNVHESAQQVWLADTLGQMLQEGTATLTAADVARTLAGMGGDLAIRVGPDRTTIVTEVLSDRGPEALRLLADVAMQPRLPESELARVKANLARNLALQLSSPQAVAQEKFAALLHGDHPYGRVFPTEAMIAGYTLEQVRAFHAAHFGPRRARLYVAGVFDGAAIQSAAQAAFGTWSGAAPGAPALPSPRGREFALLDRPGAPQSTVMLGRVVPDPSSKDWVALQVMDSLLGGSFGSRITSNIREQKGYTYSPFSSVSAHPKYAYWVQQADVTTAVTGAALKEIFGEIERLRREAPGADELRGIQNNEAGVFVVQNASRAGVIGRIAFADQHGLPADFLSTYVQQIMAVTPEDVRRLASEHLDPWRMTLVVVGDTKTVEAQVAPYRQPPGK